MRLLTNRAQFLVECLDLPAAAQADGARWEPFQIDHLNDSSAFRLTDKSRQIAYSFTVAAEAVAEAVLNAQGTIFVSINLEEAREKVRYAKLVYENLDIGGLPGLISDNVLGLEFDNGARILSLPSRPPRGKSKMNIVLDEFAHVQHDRQVYTAALPIISRGGRMRIGSSPMGATGVFWEISRQELRPYPGYVRVRVPWWHVRAFCNMQNGNLSEIDNLPTEQRVAEYGNERIQVIYENMLLDDFQQEYECLYVDEAVSYIPWELIRANQDDTLKHWHIKDVDSIDGVVVEIKAAIAAGEVEPVLVGGLDIGRKKNLTEGVFLGCGPNRAPVRIMLSLDRVRFDDQERCIKHLLKVLPISSLLIDQNGIGMQLAENLEDATHAQGVTFTNLTKQMWATELKIQLERTRIPLPCDRELAYQIHSIKKMVTPAKNVVYDTDRNEEHHADKLWALALAVWAVRDHEDRPQWGAAPVWQRR